MSKWSGGTSRRRRVESVPNGDERWMEPILQKRETHRSAFSSSCLHFRFFKPAIIEACITSQEVHIIRQYKEDFYGHVMTVLVLGYIRPELDYTSKGRTILLCTIAARSDYIVEALIEDIQMDIRVALKSLSRPAYQAYRSDPSFARNPAINCMEDRQ